MEFKGPVELDTGVDSVAVITETVKELSEFQKPIFCPQVQGGLQ